MRARRRGVLDRLNHRRRLLSGGDDNRLTGRKFGARIQVRAQGVGPIGRWPSPTPR